MKYLAYLFCLALISCTTSKKQATLSGELKTWHKLTLSVQGPETSETARPNPFTDYRLDITFIHAESGRSYKVPGYYAADGNAAHTSADSGRVWRAHFTPDATGLWTYEVSFLAGEGVAHTADTTNAQPLASHRAQGRFQIQPSDKTTPDNRAKGRLQYVGEHYLRHAGNGEYFLKQGADAPENFLAYDGFDGDFKTDGHKDKFVKDWAAHEKDWHPGDPTWAGNKGKGIIGAVNYLASEGLNAVSFLTLNIEGDDRNVFPYTHYDERFRMDCSKLDQWEIVFQHADQKGMFLHFKTQETENESLLDVGDTGPQRILYYRELVARFGHHLALNWNLGEENGSSNRNRKKPGTYQTTPQRKAMAQWFYENDPYNHHLVIHNGKFPNDLLGKQSMLTGFSLQTHKSDFRNVPHLVAEYIKKSADTGRPWVVACDEPGDASYAIRPDNDAANSHEDGRRNALWGCLMNQGSGSEYYFGYKAAHSDLTCTDYRSRDKWWDYCRHALEFFKHNAVPFWEMTTAHHLSSNEDSWCLANTGKVYLLYLKNGGSTILDLSQASGQYNVHWFNPRTGGTLKQGSIPTIQGGTKTSIGHAPSESDQDWIVLIQKQ